MPEYEDSRLWRETLASEAETDYPEHRDRLRVALERMRANVIPLAEQIAQDLPNLTVHDESHLDALWVLAEIIGGEELSLNPAEAFFFGVAVLLHDLGLAVAAYPGGVDELRADPAWQDALGIELRKVLGRAPSETERAGAPDDVKQLADEEVLRARHAERALDLARISRGNEDDPKYLIENEDLRREFASLAGQVAASHWWSVAELRRMADTHLSVASLPANWPVDALKVACLLRLADVSHLDNRRATPLRRKLQQPRGASLLHWDFQARLARPTVQGQRLRYQSIEAFGRDESEAWWMAADMLQIVDRELRQVDALLGDLGRQQMAIRGVAGVEDPARLSESVQTQGWEPVDARLSVSDVTGLARRLGGQRLYGNQPLVPLREVIQNGADAIEARRRLQPDFDGGRIDISVQPADEWEGARIEARDNGVGMTRDVLAGPLLDFGRSLWRDPEVAHALPGLAGTDFEPIGRFGIGFFSVFMFDRPVRVRSRFYLAGAEETFVLEFPAGLSRRALLRQASQVERLHEPGTVVTFDIPWLDNERDEATLDLADQPTAVIGALCPTLEVDVRVIAEGAATTVVAAGDWVQLDPAGLVARLGTTATLPELARIRPVLSPEGTVLGRGVAVPSRLYLGVRSPCVLTVGGLAATRSASIIGVLLAEEPNIARSEARPQATQYDFAQWVSEQAQLWADAGLGNIDGIALAAFVSRAGGELGDLPVCYGADGPMNRNTLRAWAAERNLIYVWEEIDDDELRLPGGWNPTFTPGPDTIVIDAPLRTGSPLELAMPDPENPVTPDSLFGLVEAEIAAAWGCEPSHLGDDYAEGAVIGSSEVDDIESHTARAYRRNED